MGSEVRACSYILKVGQPASQRLNLLQTIHGRYSQQLIFNTSIQPGNKILDIGCGTGNMACWMAKKFPQSEIIALDNSPLQLLFAKQQAQEKGVSNIRFMQVDLEKTLEIKEKFDVIYSRYSLIHVRNPLGVLQNLLGILSPSGRFVLEEPTMSTAFCYPTHMAYEKSRHLLRRLGEMRALDFEIGVKLESMLYHLGLKIEYRNLVQPLLETYEQKKLLPLLTQESQDAYFFHNLISELEFERMMVELHGLTQKKGVLIGFPRTTQICAVKSAD